MFQRNIRILVFSAVHTHCNNSHRLFPIILKITQIFISVQGIFFEATHGGTCSYDPPSMPPVARYIDRTIAINPRQFYRGYACGVCFRVRFLRLKIPSFYIFVLKEHMYRFFMTKVDSILFFISSFDIVCKIYEVFLKRNFRNMMPKHRFGSMFYEAIKLYMWKHVLQFKASVLW